MLTLLLAFLDENIVIFGNPKQITHLLYFGKNLSYASSLFFLPHLNAFEYNLMTSSSIIINTL